MTNLDMILAVIKDYLVNSTFHGLRFITEDNRHWTERIFWLICCLLSWYGSAVLIKSSWDSFQNNSISFVVETTYLGVETSFPSISVCETESAEKPWPHIIKMANQFYGPKHDSNLDETLKEIAYFKGSVYFIKNYCFTKNFPCAKKDYKKLADKVRRQCKDIFKSCRWKNETFECCSHFVPLQTECGLCYTLNSRNEPPGKSGSLNLKSSTRLELGALYLELRIPTKVYMHSEADIPFYNTRTMDVITTENGNIKRLGISVTDIENEPEVRQLTISQRGCRFSDENDLTVSTMYSYSACVTQCRLKEQLKNCNCSSHFMPYTAEEQHCDLEGVLCLTKYHEPMSILRTPWGTNGLDCSCLPGCEEPDFNIIESIQLPSNLEDQTIAVVEIYMYRYPSKRYKRNVVRGHLDLVVSMGGSTGLFVGASLLSFAEFLYYFTVRMYNTIHKDHSTAGTVQLAQRVTTLVTNVAPYLPSTVRVAALPPPKALGLPGGLSGLPASSTLY